MKQRITIALGILSVSAWSGAAEAGWQDGYLSVTNVRHDTVRVLIDSRSYGEVAPGQAQAFRLAPGSHAVTILDSRGRSVEQSSVRIEPYSAEALILDTPHGELDVTNQTAANLRIWVDGQPIGKLRPGTSMDVDLPPGPHEVRATYRQHDQRRELITTTTRIRPGASAAVRLTAPSTSLVEITNTHPVSGRIQINGATVGTVGPGETTYVEAPVGYAQIVILGSRNQVLDKERLTISAFDDVSIRTEYAQHGALSLYNPLPIPVRLVSGHHERILQPRETVAFDRIRSGSREIQVFRLTGEPIGEMSVTVRPGAPTRANVIAPRDGIVSLTNRSSHVAYVYVDNQLVEQIQPYAEARLVVPVGGHRVRVTAGGRERFDQTLSIDRYQEAEVSIGRGGHGGSGHSSHGHRGGHRGHDDVSSRW